MCGVGVRGIPIFSEQLSLPWGASAVAAATLILVVAVRVRVARRHLRDELRCAADALAARTTELATLHAIGREILSTLDPARVFSIVERECRKVFDVELFVFGVVDRRTSQIRLSYRGAGAGATAEAPAPLGCGLASRVVASGRELRIDDPHAALRSAIGAPLLVEGRVVGVLCVLSAREGAYDDHHLALLATIAQQAAVAVENARHHALATIDSLTGLYLRDIFFRRLEEEHARARRYDGSYALLMLDIDGFKAINDREGHLAGDRYLRGVGAAIRSCLRGADLACRYGGDEFCILLPETDLAGAHPIAERLRRVLAELVVDVDAGSVRATASIGVSVYPLHAGADVRTLLLRADQALYQAKRAGRDRIVAYTPASRPQDVLNAPSGPREERLGQ